LIGDSEALPLIVPPPTFSVTDPVVPVQGVDRLLPEAGSRGVELTEPV
jgi:hypothetical protein